MPNNFIHTLHEACLESNQKEGLDRVLGWVTENVDADAVVLYLCMPKTGDLKTTVVKGMEQAHPTGLARHVAEKLEPIRLLRQGLPPRSEDGKKEHFESFKAYLAVPIVSLDKALGVLEVQRKRAQPFSDDDTTLLLTLSAQLAGLIVESSGIVRLSLKGKDLKSGNRASQQHPHMKNFGGSSRVFGAAYQNDPTLPAVFPEAWANEWGEDQYGLWMAFTYRGVRHVLRWIVPGRFWMGSPQNETEREPFKEIFERDETRHGVILTEGFWLGETSVTQALWQLVMGGNPSRFQGEERPVERVSWENVQVFLERFNGERDDLGFCLPTEAQWEYACRAGTETPFWFGENITPLQVNYRGDYPNVGEKKAMFRRETVGVMSLPCNCWGLYQMHGNVWEWCQDWYGEYPHGLVTDPLGPETGVRRVLRGGSWTHGAWICRSAYRDHWEPGSNNRNAGFRLARGRNRDRQEKPGN